MENEISVVTASQVMESMDKQKYEIVPIYIAKTGKWYTGAALLELEASAKGLCKRILMISIMTSVLQATSMRTANSPIV